VDLNGRAYGDVAQFVCLLEKLVHKNLLHQRNEGNEEFCQATPVSSPQSTCPG
jgi:hypothetical protein